MKIHCYSCGCHFDTDFEETLESECSLWRDRGFSLSMSREHKLALWNAYFSVPVDDIADQTGVITQISFQAQPGAIYKCNEFEAYVPNYRYMDDAERRAFQKRLFKFQYTQSIGDRLRMQLKEMGEWDSLVLAEEVSKNLGEEPTTDVVCMSDTKRKRIRGEQ